MLLDAIVRGRLYQVKFLLDSKSVNVNIMDFNGQTPLIKAVLLEDKMHRTRFKIVRLLLEHGAKVNLTDKDGKTALMLATIYGLQDITELILGRCLMDLDLNAGDLDGNTALIHSAIQGHDAITSKLVTALNRFGLDVDKKNAFGLTAMLMATLYGQEDCARVLYTQGGASLTIRDPERFMNATEWAVVNQLVNFLEVVEKSKQEPGQLCTENPDNEIPVTTKIEVPLCTGLGAPLMARSRPQTPNNCRIEEPRGTGKRASVRTRPETLNDGRIEAPQGTKQRASMNSRSRPQTPNNGRIEAPQGTGQRASVRSRPQTPNRIEAPQGTKERAFFTTWSRPETPINGIKRPLSSKKTVPGVNYNLNQVESPTIVLDNSRISYANNMDNILTGVNQKQAKSELGSKTSKSLLLTRAKSGKARLNKNDSERCASAKSEIQNLLSIYGAQNSFSYRKGYDPASLPPSGMWPDPNSMSTSDSIDGLNGLGEMDYLCESSLSFGRKSVLGGSAARRMSTIGQIQNGGRRMSIIGQGNANMDKRTSLAGRKAMVNQPPPQKNMLEAFGRRDRRMSVTPRSNVSERPTLRRINTHMTSPVLG